MTTAFSITAMENNVNAKEMSGYANKKISVYKNSGLTKKVGTLRKFKTVKYGKLHKNKSNKKIRYIKSSKLKGYVISKNISKTQYGSYFVGDYRYYWKNYKSNTIKIKQIKNTNENNETNNQNKMTAQEFQSRARLAAFNGINKERHQRNMSSLTMDDQMNELASRRAKELQTRYSHYDESGSSLVGIEAKEMNISYSYIDENIGETSGLDTKYYLTPEKFAANIVHEMIYNDAHANWGHRDSLLRPNSIYVGIGACLDIDSVFTETISINLKS